MRKVPPPRVPEAITKAVEKSLEGIVTGNVPDPWTSILKRI